jgi:hypothetical protein
MNGSHTALNSAAQRSARLALLSMLLLVLQGTSLSLALRFSRIKPGTPYLASVSVLLTEMLKLVICVSVQLWKCRAAALEDNASVFKECRKQMYFILSQALPMLLPAGMFVMQQVGAGGGEEGEGGRLTAVEYDGWGLGALVP